MKRFTEGESRQQVTLLPECLDDYIGEDNPVRIVDAFVEELDLLSLAFGGAERSCGRWRFAIRGDGGWRAAGVRRDALGGPGLLARGGSALRRW
jgi:hypothetical protein